MLPYLCVYYYLHATDTAYSGSLNRQNWPMGSLVNKMSMQERFGDGLSREIWLNGKGQYSGPPWGVVCSRFCCSQQNLQWDTLIDCWGRHWKGILNHNNYFNSHIYLLTTETFEHLNIHTNFINFVVCSVYLISASLSRLICVQCKTKLLHFKRLNGLSFYKELICI